MRGPIGGGSGSADRIERKAMREGRLAEPCGVSAPAVARSAVRKRAQTRHVAAFALESLMDGVKYFRNAAERYRRLAVKATEERIKAQHLRLSVAMDNLAADIEDAYISAGTLQSGQWHGRRADRSSRLH